MKDSFPLLEKISSPEDLRELSIPELQQLCAEIRTCILQTVSANGGHLASNLGIVELTIALERTFSGPQDRILWDVGHQGYVHKLLTGRLKQFSTLRKSGGLSGFLSPAESPHDVFYTGHAGVALSEAMGFSSASSQCHPSGGWTAAVVGDGSLGCGISLEALNNIRCRHRDRLLLIINDNRMSISRSVGAFSRYLNRMIIGKHYNSFKDVLKRCLRRIPFGFSLIRGIRRMESAMKSLLVPGALFEELGFKYVGPINGHDLNSLLTHLRKIRQLSGHQPVALHVVTEKGHGWKFAEESPERFHGTGPFDPETGKSLSPAEKGETFSAAFGSALERLAERNEQLAAVTAAMSGGTSLDGFSKRFPDRFFDVGIAEEHAVVFAGGLAAGGMHPVVAIYATFLQRALDNVYHDICLQDLPVVFCVDRDGVVTDGPTHHGLYDLAFLRTMPNLSILYPADASMLHRMLSAALEQKHPVMIRYPKGSAAALAERIPPFRWGKSALLKEGHSLVIWALGRECVTALETAALLEKQGVSVAVRDVRFLKPFDAEQLFADAREFAMIVSISDTLIPAGPAGVMDSLLADRAHGKILHFGWPPETVIPHGSPAELRKRAGLEASSIADRILSVWRKA